MRNIRQLFTSVRLAIFLLAALAVTSIIGTIIPQHQTYEWYAERYSPHLATFFQVLDIPAMYGSWWFTGLLALLAINLIACSLERLPKVLALIQADPAATPALRLEKMPLQARWPQVGNAALPSLKKLLVARGFTAANDAETLFIAAKGAWSRLGAYIVHLSILVIFAGALIGQYYGFKGSVMLPEGKSTDVVFLNQSHQAKNLGFTVRCDLFAIEYYDNGMPKEYLSRLTVLENGTPVVSRDIEVNKPLRHNGITFYQASYQPFQDFIIELAKKSGPRHAFTVPYQKQEEWSEEGLAFGVISAEALGQRLERLKLWLKIGAAEAVTLNLAAGEEGELGPYKIRARQLYATGLQVAKDPGVPLVYLGCGLLIFGLYTAFFQAHRRLFVILPPTSSGDIRLIGATNKNRLGFARDFATLRAEIDNTLKG
ncbi:MAG: cytochrome c biogenesis protein ResB [Desulfobulbaceae bacterium]|jgi:cytochrome c biogenesis protein|nr:cytochrome c biogenesis protein ResB [Desulfobulbaceae bacterium]